MKNSSEQLIVLSMNEMQTAFGQNDAFLKKIERQFRVSVVDRDGVLHVTGREENVRHASAVILELVGLQRNGKGVEEQSVDYAIALRKKEVVQEEGDGV